MRPLRTLVISDLHLGTRRRNDVLRRPAALSKLLETLAVVDRLILLGDVVELMERRTAQAMQTAEPVLNALGDAMRGGEVIVVPGNHDAPLVRAWARRNASRLAAETVVPADATPLLSRLTQLLGRAEVRVSYPGVWLDDRTWATHGHYVNRHLIPGSAVGLPRRWIGQDPSARRPGDYERGRRRATRARRIPDALDETLRWLSYRALWLPRHLLSPRISPLTVRMLGVQLSQAVLPAMLRVAAELQVRAEFVVFGHVHRLGPLPGDDLLAWAGEDGRPRLLNTGSWLYEPLLAHRAGPPHPYWPGGAVMLQDDAEPQAIGLLDGVSAAAFRPEGGTTSRGARR